MPAQTPSVRSAVAALPPETTASAIAAKLLAIHPEYGEHRGGDVKLDPTLGESKPTSDWMASVEQEFADDAMIVHGRAAILALARLDKTLSEQLALTGLQAALEGEIKEPIDELFGSAPPDDEEHYAPLPNNAVADMPDVVDRLGFSPLVIALRAVLDDATLPLAVAVTGNWGSGKSSVMRQLEHELKDGQSPRRWTTVRFDAWKYERSERLWAALAKSIYDGALAQRRWWASRLRFRIALEWRRLGRWRFFLRFAWPVLAAAAAVAVLASADLSAQGRAAGSLTLAASAVVLVQRYWRAIADPFKRAVEQHASHPNYEEQLGFTSEADHDIVCLLRTVASGKDDAVAVFVDDLDRCNAAHLVEVVEAVNQIFNSDERQREHGNRCVFVLGLDREMVAKSIEAAYGSTGDRLEKANSPMAQDFGFRYIDKLVQLSVNLPRPRIERLRGMLTASDERGFEFRQRARDRVKTARQSTEFDKVEHGALSLLELNPRQAKRFHNLFRLQVYVAAAEGEPLEDRMLPTLARWVALRLRWPRLADDLDREPGLRKLLDEIANEDRESLAHLSGVELQLRENYDHWFTGALGGAVGGVLVVTKQGESRISDLRLETFLNVS